LTYIEHDEKLTKVYTSGGIYALCRHVTDGMHPKTILDLGAHYGDGYESFGMHHPNAEYIMVEPVHTCIQRIRFVLESNPGSNIKLIDGVIGMHAGITEMKTFDTDNCQSSNMFSDRGGAYGTCHHEVVKMHPYDVLPDVIDFAKVNIEGGEYKLIDDNFFDRVTSFVMEVHNNLIPGLMYIQVIDRLRSTFNLTTCGNLDYKYCFVIGHRI
jgi:FkbM family methyltransferase